jgi:dihydrofolate reductase
MTVGDDLMAYCLEVIQAADTLLFGRVTYEGMAGFWGTEAPQGFNAPYANRMTELPKIVASRTLESVDWADTRIIADDAEAQVAELKHQPGGDIVMLGSRALTVDLLAKGLIDELQIYVCPVLLGGGQPLLEGADRSGLTLLGTRSFSDGNVLLTYRVAAKD